MTDINALPVVLPGLQTYLLTALIIFSPLFLLLLLQRLFPRALPRLPEAGRAGINLAVGIICSFVCVISLWLISSNGAWHDDSHLEIRATRAFVARVELAALDPAAAHSIDIDSLSRQGGLRVPGYAGGPFVDASGRNVFVMHGGGTLLRIPARGDYDIALSLQDTSALDQLTPLAR